MIAILILYVMIVIKITQLCRAQYRIQRLKAYRPYDRNKKAKTIARCAYHIRTLSIDLILLIVLFLLTIGVLQWSMSL